MTIQTWLQAAITDAQRRGLTTGNRLVEGLAVATPALRAPDFNEDAS